MTTREEINEKWDRLRAEMMTTLEGTTKNLDCDRHVQGIDVLPLARMIAVMIAEIDLLRDRVKALGALPIADHIAPEDFTGKVVKIDGETFRVLRRDAYQNDHWYADHGEGGAEVSVSEAAIRKALGKQS